MFNFLHWYHCYHDNFFIIVIMIIFVIIVIMIIFVIIVIMIILIIIVIMISSVLSLLSWYHLCYHCYHVIFCVIIVIMISSVLSLLSWYHLCYHFYHVIFWPRGDSGTIGSSNLSTVTNMNIDEVDFLFIYSLLHLNLSVWNQNLFWFCIFFIAGKHCVQSYWWTILRTPLCGRWGGTSNCIGTMFLEMPLYGILLSYQIQYL